METASTINSGKKMEKPSFDVKTLDLFFSAALPTQSDISNAKALPPLISQHSSKGDLANTRQWTQKLEQRSIHANITDITWRDNKIYLYNPTFFGAAQSSWCQPRKKKQPNQVQWWSNRKTWVSWALQFSSPPENSNGFHPHGMNQLNRRCEIHVLLTNLHSQLPFLRQVSLPVF